MLRDVKALARTVTQKKRFNEICLAVNGSTHIHLKSEVVGYILNGGGGCVRVEPKLPEPKLPEPDPIVLSPSPLTKKKKPPTRRLEFRDNIDKILESFHRKFEEEKGQHIDIMPYFWSILNDYEPEFTEQLNIFSQGIDSRSTLDKLKQHIQEFENSTDKKYNDENREKIGACFGKYRAFRENRFAFLFNPNFSLKENLDHSLSRIACAKLHQQQLKDLITGTTTTLEVQSEENNRVFDLYTNRSSWFQEDKNNDFFNIEKISFEYLGDSCVAFLFNKTGLDAAIANLMQDELQQFKTKYPDFVPFYTKLRKKIPIVYKCVHSRELNDVGSVNFQDEKSYNAFFDQQVVKTEIEKAMTAIKKIDKDISDDELYWWKFQIQAGICGNV